jgi:hypothetical protein
MRLRLETAHCLLVVDQEDPSKLGSEHSEPPNKIQKMEDVRNLIWLAQGRKIFHVCLFGGSKVIENGAEGFCPQKFYLLSVKTQTKTLKVSSRSNCRVVL